MGTRGERGDSCGCVSSGLTMLLAVLLTPAVSCSGVVNLMHTGQRKQAREREREIII